jgi:ubiquinone/menaquinone biosynthesis C-methylase UbiE
MSVEPFTIDCFADGSAIATVADDLVRQAQDIHAAANAARQARIDAVGFPYALVPKQRLDECNLCGSKRLVEVTTQDRYGFPVGLSVCECCGLTFINPRMSDEHYQDFYKGTYRALIAAHSGQDHSIADLEVSATRYAGGMLQMVAEFMVGRQGQCLLDIGGSTGVVAAALKGAFGLSRAIVLDPCLSELKAAEKRGCMTIHGTAESLCAKNGPVDVITLLQTVDHLLDIRGTLQTIRALLHKDGLFVVDIVNWQTMLDRFGLVPSIKIDHPYYLTQETFESYLVRAGFAIAQAFMSEDERHVTYLCRAGEVQDKLPAEGYSEQVLAQLTTGAVR